MYRIEAMQCIGNVKNIGKVILGSLKPLAMAHVRPHSVRHKLGEISVC